MEDWRSPRARIKKRIRRGVFWAAALAGRLTQQTPNDLAVRPQETVSFYGHRIGQDGALAELRETRLVFSRERPAYETVSGLFYSPTGIGWSGGKLIEKFSVCPIFIGDLVARPPVAVEKISDCAVVECDSAYSYGDWTHCYLGTVLSVDFPDVPVFIPHHLAQKSYVRRDLAQAGVRWTTARGWVEMERAYVLRKPNPLTYWSTHEVRAYREAFGIRPSAPLPGSISYMGRFDFQGELFARHFPSHEVAACITAMGGKVINQADLNTSTSHRFSQHVETVVGDHGSGMLNILFWQPKTIIELVVDNSWVNNTLFVAAAMGVKNFGVLRVDGLSRDEIAGLLEACLMHFSESSQNKA